MKLRAQAGQSFELVILGYEHPDITEGWWESNWLVVGGRATLEGQSWRFTAPCVTTFELAELAEWLENLRNGSAEDPVLAFAEPNLAFSCFRVPAPTLAVRLAHGSAPPWLTEPFGTTKGVVVEFPLAEVDPEEAAAALRDALQEFPIRGGAA